MKVLFIKLLLGLFVPVLWLLNKLGKWLHSPIPNRCLRLERANQWILNNVSVLESKVEAQAKKLALRHELVGRFWNGKHNSDSWFV